MEEKLVCFHSVDEDPRLRRLMKHMRPHVLLSCGQAIATQMHEPPTLIQRHHTEPTGWYPQGSALSINLEILSQGCWFML